MVALACSACDGEPSPAIVLITIDTLRADHLSGYGYDKPTSPNLDELMNRGMTFSWAFATSSSTAPSHASIMTGLYPPFHSVGPFNMGAYLNQFQLDPEVETAAELLGKQGFRTAAVVSNPILAKQLGLAQGFEIYDDQLEVSELNRNMRERYAKTAVDKALALIERFRGEPFFVWLHLQDPHGPYDPPDRWLRKFPRHEYNRQQQLPVGDDHSGYQSIPRYQAYRDDPTVGDYVHRYDAEIAYADGELGRLFAYLDSHQNLRNTLLIVTSDHGEALGEDEFYFAHSHSLELNLVRVPLVLVGPGIRAGSNEHRPVSNAWLFDTMLHYVDGVSDENSEQHKRSLFHLADDKLGWDPEPVYMDNLNQIAVAYGDTFVRQDRYPESHPGFWDSPNPNSLGFWKPLGKEALSLRTGQKQNVDGEVEQLLQAHLPAMTAWRERYHGPQRPVPKTLQQVEALRSLGYLK